MDARPTATLLWLGGVRDDVARSFRIPLRRLIIKRQEGRAIRGHMLTATMLSGGRRSCKCLSKNRWEGSKMPGERYQIKRVTETWHGYLYQHPSPSRQ